MRALCLAALLLFAGEVYLFTLLNADPILLARILRNQEGGSKLEKVLGIQQRLMASSSPGRREAMLVADLLFQLDRKPEVVALLTHLTRRSPNELGARLRLADLLAQGGKFDEAEVEYSEILKRMDGQSIPPTTEERATFLLAAARSAEHLRRHGVAAERFTRCVTLRPEDTELRQEYAGILTLAGRLKESLGQYARVAAESPQDMDVRYRMVEVYCADGQFAAAERACLDLAAIPAEAARARKMLGEILIWKKDYAGALGFYLPRGRFSVTGRDDRIKVAWLLIWRKEFDRALEFFQGLLDEELDHPELWAGWLDAAAGAQQVGEAQRKVALAIAGRVTQPERDPVHLTRLAWVLARVKEQRRGLALLEQAVSMAPGNRQIRLQLADTAHDLGLFDLAEQHYVVLLRSIQERR